jgi:hypothetical protein
MKKLQNFGRVLSKEEQKKITGGYMSVCVSCGGSTGVACASVLSDWDCQGDDATGSIICSNAQSGEYFWTRYCCPQAQGCTASSHPY